MAAIRRLVRPVGVAVTGFSAIALALAGCSDNPPRPADPVPVATSRVLQLPAPATDGGMSLNQALAQRRSVREFVSGAVSLEQIGQLLWAAQGWTEPDGRRTAPSAGALYPLELYAVSAERVMHYRPDGNRLDARAVEDLRPDLAAAALDQDAVRTAPLVIVMAAAPDRTRERYGARTDTFVALEAGHAAQNLLLAATALGLGAVPIGAFDADRVARLLSLPAGEVALYLIPVGHPR